MPAIFDPAHSPQVKAWLTKELGPICDAEPDVLADYVIALLKHDASEGELKSLLDEQLADFLDDKTSPFVSKLVKALSTKSYLPSSAAAPSGPSSSRKRPAENDEDARPAAKSARPSNGSAELPRGPAADRNASNGTPVRERERDISERASAGPQQQQQQQQPTKSKDLCRDFHQKGWCSRGEQCRFEHSTDAIMGTTMQQQGGFPQMQQQGQQQGGPGQQGPGGQFNQQRQGQPGGPGPNGFMGRPPMMMNMPPGVMPGFAMQMGGPQGWNGGPPGPMPMGFPPQGQQQQRQGSNGPESMPLGMRLGEQQQQQPPMAGSPPMGHDGMAQPSHRGGFAGRGGRGGSGPSAGRPMPGHFQSRARSTTTLVIENVPADSLDLIKINDYFKRFGTITNIQIDAPGSKALVSYSAPHEAKAAHESPDVIFGNRFVKVYFQKLDEGPAGGAPGGSVPRPPPQQRQTFAAGQNVYRPPTASTSGTSSPSHPSSSPAPPTSAAAAAGGLTPEQQAERRQALESQRAAQHRVNELMTEQKQLLVKATSTATSAEDKKASMKRLRELEPSIKEATEKVREAVKVVASLPQPQPVAQPPKGAPGGAGPSSLGKAGQREKMEKDRLDRELEAHASAPVVSGSADEGEGSNGAAPSTSSQTEGLRAKLEALKAEYTALGLDSNGGASSSHSSGGGRGGYTPRGGRGRGRGGASAPMRLDNRSTKLYVVDAPEGEEPRQKVKEWLQGFGEVVSFEQEEAEAASGKKVAFALTYKHRFMGEQAVRTLSAVSSGAASAPEEVGKIGLVWAPAAARPASASGAATPQAAAPVAAAAAEEGGADGENDGEENWKR